MCACSTRYAHTKASVIKGLSLLHCNAYYLILPYRNEVIPGGLPKPIADRNGGAYVRGGKYTLMRVSNVLWLVFLR